jgi:hypothetical protein
MEAEAEVAVRHSAGSRASPKALAPSCATGPLLLLMDRCGTRLPGPVRQLASREAEVVEADRFDACVRWPWRWRLCFDRDRAIFGETDMRTADLRRCSQVDLDRIAAERNGRTRQILGFKTPSQALTMVLG